MRTCPHCGNIFNSLHKHLSHPLSTCHASYLAGHGYSSAHSKASRQADLPIPSSHDKLLELIAPVDEDYSDAPDSDDGEDADSAITESLEQLVLHATAASRTEPDRVSISVTLRTAFHSLTPQ
jgi:hypothetical protein